MAFAIPSKNRVRDREKERDREEERGDIGSK